MNSLRHLVSSKPILVFCMTMLFFSTTPVAALQVSVGDSVRLKAFSDLGVPLHPASGDRSVSDRLPGGTVATVQQIDQQNGWMKITGAGTSGGWVIKKYIPQVISAGEGLPTNLSYVVGSWNLEHFHDGAARGFPENTRGGLSYGPRSQEDYETIAAMIENLEVRILVLEEVFAMEIEDNGAAKMRSQEVERLIHILGSQNYDYMVGESGSSQHIAILYDQRHVRLNTFCECDFPEERVNGKQIFYRQALFAHFTFLHGGQLKNDLLVVGVHLASGQGRTKNHDRAMELVVEELTQARADGTCIPPDENDILITGDFNANRFDNKVERFWGRMENNGWDVLADNDTTYPATRLSGVPLVLGTSKIDYIIVTKGNQGLAGEEIAAVQAIVHTELIAPNAISFRKQASDHIPVTVEVKVVDDTDHSVD